MAASLTVFRGKKVTATGPTDATEWKDVSGFSHLNARASISAASGTNPRIELEVEFTDDRESTTSSGAIVKYFLADFWDQADDVLVSGIPIFGRYARIQRTVSGTSPAWVLEVGATLYGE